MMYENYCKLNINGAWIGLEDSSKSADYFCTPKGSYVIGWENCIHYCFIESYDEMVFAVNPESCAYSNVYPLAKDFRDFLKLILACGSTTPIEQIIHMTEERFINFLHSDDNVIFPEQQHILDKIKSALELEPMSNPYEYVRDLQASYDASKIKYSNDYYDALGLERPDGSSRDSVVAFREVSFIIMTDEK